MNKNIKIKEVNYEVREIGPADLGVMGNYRRTGTPRTGVRVET